MVAQARWSSGSSDRSLPLELQTATCCLRTHLQEADSHPQSDKACAYVKVNRPHRDRHENLACLTNSTACKRLPIFLKHSTRWRVGKASKEPQYLVS